MTCTLICQKQCLCSGSNMLLLFHSKVNTRTTKAGGVSEFLLGREVVNLNSSNEEWIRKLPVVTDIQDLHHIWYRRHFNLWPPAQKCQMFFHSIEYFWIPTKKEYIKSKEKLLTERKPLKKSKGGKCRNWEVM